MPYSERALWKVYTLIDSRCRENGLPDSISSDAKAIYTKVAK